MNYDQGQKLVRCDAFYVELCGAWKPERLPDNRPITASLGVT